MFFLELQNNSRLTKQIYIFKGSNTTFCQKNEEKYILEDFKRHSD